MVWPVTNAAGLWRGAGSPAGGPSWEALGEAVRDAAGRVLAGFRNLPPESREDATQDATIACLEAIRSGAVQVGREDGFVAALARNRGIDLLRRRREHASDLVPDAGAPPPPLAPALDLRDCLERADAGDRALLTRMLLAGASLEELAAAEVDPATPSPERAAAHRRARNRVDQRWKRAKARLLDCIEGRG